MKTFFQTAIATIILSLVSVSAGYGLEIEIKDFALVEDQTVLLGDIADLTPYTETAAQLADQELFRAPEPGKSTSFRVADIRRYVDRAVADPDALSWTGSDRVMVERTAVTIGPEQITTAIENFLSQNRGYIPQAEIRIRKLSLPAPFDLPAGDLDIEIIPSDPSVFKSSRFTLIFRVNGRVEKNIAVRAELEAMAPIVMAAADLHRGSILSDADITIAQYDLTSLRDTVFSTHEEVIGQRLKRSLRQGMPIHSGLVEIPAMIERGDLVTIIANKGPLTISAKGIAVSDGRKNEQIQIRNTTSQKLIQCRVNSPGLVIVEY